MKLRPIATARPVFEAVSLRLGVDTDVLMHLFGECLDEVLKEVQTTGACTIRGYGKFSLSLSLSPNHSHLLPDVGKTARSLEPVTVFERSKYAAKNRPFQALQLKKRLAAKD